MGEVWMDQSTGNKVYLHYLHSLTSADDPVPW